MRKVFFILFFFVSFFSFAQKGVQYKPDVVWKTVVDSVIYLNPDTFSVRAIPFDYNDPGAIDREIGGYLIDNIGHIYTIIESSNTTITVVDEFNYRVSPVEGEIGIVYKSVGFGNAPYIAPIHYEFLSSKARDNAERLFKDILWKHGETIPFDSLEDTPNSKIGEGGNFVTVDSSEVALTYTPANEIKLTAFDSTDFRITESQISDFQDVSDTTEVFYATDSQTNFTLENEVFIEYTVSQNGVILPTTSYSISTNILTVNVGVLENDRIQINYKYLQ